MTSTLSLPSGLLIGGERVTSASSPPSLRRAHRVARQLQAGSVWVNKFSDISLRDRMGATNRVGSAAAADSKGSTNSFKSRTSASACSDKGRAT